MPLPIFNSSRIIRSLLAAVFATLFLGPASAQNNLPVYTITGKELSSIDNRLFGAFFEKANWNGEIGSDAAISLKTRQVFPEVIDYMKWMNIPILRFPGGTAIDYYPWYYLIDHMPGKHQTRPENRNYKNLADRDVLTSDGRMGLHEYISLCRQLNIEPHLVTNLGDAFYKKLPFEQAAQELGADLVQYCNDKEGKWAELRSLNGHKEPFNVKYFQIGNECWLFDGFGKNERTPELLNHYTNCVEAYARAMKKADPSIKLIIDGAEGLGVEVMKRCGELIAFNTFHSYSPWGISEIKKEGRTLDENEYSAKEVWEGLATTPHIDTITGLSVISDWVLENVKTPIALTEWNINCWFQGKAKKARPENEFLAYGIGAGSYLNAILRQSDKIHLANQSMLVGTGWGITGIRIDTTETNRPTLFPTAMVSGLYSRNCGDKLLEVKSENTIYYNQPLTLNGVKPAPKVAEQDLVITADKDYYFVHIVNRSFDNNREIILNFPEKVAKNYTQFLLSDRTKGTLSKMANFEEIHFFDVGKSVKVMVHARSVSVFRFKK